MENRSIYDSDHALFRANARRFFREELEPNIEEWENASIVPRSFWRSAGEKGLLCCGIPEEYGGPGADFKYNMISSEEIGYAIGGGSCGFALQSDITAYYILNHASEELKQKWLPPMVSGEVISSIAMTEPSTGSDLQAIRTTAIRDGDEYVINGQKTFITNGQHSDFVIVVCKTDPTLGAKGISLVIVETGTPGYEKGRNLDKIGQKGADTSEMFFADVRVPVTNLIGEEGKGFGYLMSELPRERLTVAFRAWAEAQRAYEITVEYTKEREAFGKPLFAQQNTAFSLADVATELAVGWAFLDQCLAKIVAGTLTAQEGAMAKLWTTEKEGKIVDTCLQFFGGYGYMREYPISRMYTDARVRRIYGGSTEIMKLFIGRSL
jgi:long-chain-acyl-CoA dehydrogenase